MAGCCSHFPSAGVISQCYPANAAACCVLKRTKQLLSSSDSSVILRDEGAHHAFEETCWAVQSDCLQQHFVHRLAHATLDAGLGQIQRHCGTGCACTTEAPQCEVLPSLQVGLAPFAFDSSSQPA